MQKREGVRLVLDHGEITAADGQLGQYVYGRESFWGKAFSVFE